ncbi:hypothetical protein E2C01_078218 [Portunus trituberculatus]|uniref:Uncharacterized protein n=1 Tax=Portunus trituberculatus TaxID=210409 RepID=A0A5B7IPH9_PORTR|nr:hypothetical protein [Portunus trituberculatus]
MERHLITESRLSFSSNQKSCGSITSLRTQPECQPGQEAPPSPLVPLKTSTSHIEGKIKGAELRDKRMGGYSAGYSEPPPTLIQFKDIQSEVSEVSKEAKLRNERGGGYSLRYSEAPPTRSQVWKVKEVELSDERGGAYPPSYSEWTKGSMITITSHLYSVASAGAIYKSFFFY